MSDPEVLRPCDSTRHARPVKVLALRRDDACSTCAAPLSAGQRAAWDATARQVHCLGCRATTELSPSSPPSPAVPEHPTGSHGGASAQREYDRRSSKREDRIRTAHPRLGRLLLALSEEPSSTRVWAQGAAGERAVAAALDQLTEEGVLTLHDRRLRRPDGRLSRANIDHFAVAASGVWVIDAKTHQGALEVRRSGGLLSPRREALYIGGRDRTALVHGLLQQVEAVRTTLTEVQAHVTVRGALCFVGTELPWFGSSTIVDVPLVGRRGLTKLLRGPGDLVPDERQAVAEFLAGRFPPA